MIFYVTGTAKIDFMERVEAETSDDAVRKVMLMKVVDLTWEAERINVTDVAEQAEKKP